MSLSKVPLKSEEMTERKTCWVCFANEADDPSETWVRPCRCRGTTKWVHHSCLQRWVDEKQKGNSATEVMCPQCNTQYIIVFPHLGPAVKIMEWIDRLIFKICPFMAGGIFVGSVYWTAVTYGAVTVMQVLGHKEGLNVMERADPLFLLIGLPTIPIILTLGKMVRWEEYVLRIWRKHSKKLPLLSYIFNESLLPARTPTEIEGHFSNPLSATRILCGALILPTIATVAGKLMFGSVSSNFQRTLLGGIAFVSIKGLLKVYYRQQQYLRQAHRQILNFPEEAITPATTTTPKAADQ